MGVPVNRRERMVTSNESLILQGPAGQLEAVLIPPLQENLLAVICHPHPLYQGSMHNKVVTTLTRAYELVGIGSLRFNFRGVGNSEGSYGHGAGEIEDALAVVEAMRQAYPHHRIGLAGFSFGAFIAASVAALRGSHHLITVAPAVHHSDYESLAHVPCPWLVIGAEADEIVPITDLLAWVDRSHHHFDFIEMKGASHFFHGCLMELRGHILDWVASITRPELTQQEH